MMHCRSTFARVRQSANADIGPRGPSVVDLCSISHNRCVNLVRRYLSSSDSQRGAALQLRMADRSAVGAEVTPIVLNAAVAIANDDGIRLAAPAAAQIAPTYRSLGKIRGDLTHGAHILRLVEGGCGGGDRELAFVRDEAWQSGFIGCRWDLVVLSQFTLNRSRKG